jgi:hypothetical protein
MRVRDADPGVLVGIAPEKIDGRDGCSGEQKER